MTTQLVRFLGMAAVFGLIFLTPSFGDEPKPRATDDPKPKDEVALDLPREWEDPGFDRYLNARQLQQALGAADASLLCDVALQLAEGERILLRPHKAIPAARLFTIVARLAAERRDTAALDRLAKAAGGRGDKEFAAALELAQKAARAPRSASGIALPLDSVNPEQVNAFRLWVETIQLSKAMADRENLEEMEKDLKEGHEFEGKLKAHLLKLIAEAKESLPEQPDPSAEALNKLLAGSRANNMGDVKRDIERRWKGVVWGPHFDHRAYAIMIAQLAAAPGSQAAWILDMVNKAGRILGAHSILLQVVHQRREISHGGRVLYSGIATYNHWETLRIGRFSRKVPLPNTHQPYIAWR